MDPSGVAARLRDQHPETLAAVATCQRQAAAELDHPTARSAVVARQDAALRDADLLEPLVGVLESGMAAAGADPEADPVPAPPYVVVTGRGPLLRATAGGERLVVLLRGFERVSDGYAPVDDVAVEATVRRTP
jgi:hypothetical protein